MDHQIVTKNRQVHSDRAVYLVSPLQLPDPDRAAAAAAAGVYCRPSFVWELMRRSERRNVEFFAWLCRDVN